MSKQPRISDREVIHRGKKFDFERVNLAPAGSEPVWREVVRHPGAVCILPLLEPTVDHPEPRLVLIRNHRFAIGGKSGSLLWEIPAGTMEPGESPEQTGGRELEEEAGYRAGRLSVLTSFYTTPGMTDERMVALFASDLTVIGQRLEGDERIEVHVFPVTEVMRMIDCGEIVDGKTVLTVLFAVRAGLLDDAKDES
jgi:ADP-ribose pyrophosphatase